MSHKKYLGLSINAKLHDNGDWHRQIRVNYRRDNMIIEWFIIKEWGEDIKSQLFQSGIQTFIAVSCGLKNTFVCLLSIM